MKIFSPEELEVAAALLQQEELVAFPTETVYGLGAIISSDRALRKIFEAKGRPQDNPLIAHIAHIDQLEELAVCIPKSAYLLARAFWPGPLTLVLRRAPAVSEVLAAGLETVAVRMPSHKIARRLIELTGEPLAAPSANLSGKPSATCWEHVASDFAGKIGGVIAAEPSELGIESSVISLAGEEPLLLRPGHITRLEVEAVLGCKVREALGAERRASPGTRYRHYAPKGAVRLAFREEDLGAKRPGTLVLRGVTARGLYAALREADEGGAEQIEILCDERVQADEALMNRLRLAAGMGAFS